VCNKENSHRHGEFNLQCCDLFTIFLFASGQREPSHRPVAAPAVLVTLGRTAIFDASSNVCCLSSLRRNTNIHSMMASLPANSNTSPPYDAQASTNYKEAFALFDKRGTQRVQIESLGDLLRACGQNPTLAEIRDLEKGLGNECTLPFLFAPIWALRSLALDNIRSKAT
jgi:hypothetical protein